MNEEQYSALFELPAFKKIKEFILDDDITDIDSDGDVLLLRSAKEQPYFSKHVTLSSSDNLQIGFWVANRIGVQLNAITPYVEADISELRICVTLDSVSTGGCGLTIRKIPALCRLNKSKMVKTKYAEKRMVNFMEDVIAGDNNVFVSGLPSVGKTELIKYLIGFINPLWKIITIEDLNELHAKKLYPARCIEEDRINEFYNWDTAIIKALRKNPHHLIFAEARGSEVKQLLTAILAGTKCITSIHANTPYEIPQRINMMLGNHANSDTLLFSAVQVAFGIDMIIVDGKLHRYVRDCVAFDSKNMEVIKLWEYEFNKKAKYFDIPSFLNIKWRDD